MFGDAREMNLARVLVDDEKAVLRVEMAIGADNVPKVSHIEKSPKVSRCWLTPSQTPTNERTLKMSMKTETEKEALKLSLKVDPKNVQDSLQELVRSTVEETLNSMLDAEADALCGAERYERSPDRTDTRAGSYKRKLQTQAGEVELRMPKLRQTTFETQIIERYRRRQCSVEEALMEMYLAGVSVRRVLLQRSSLHEGLLVNEVEKYRRHDLPVVLRSFETFLNSHPQTLALHPQLGHCRFPASEPFRSQTGHWLCTEVGMSA